MKFKYHSYRQTESFCRLYVYRMRFTYEPVKEAWYQHYDNNHVWFNGQGRMATGYECEQLSRIKLEVLNRVYVRKIDSEFRDWDTKGLPSDTVHI